MGCMAAMVMVVMRGSILLLSSPCMPLQVRHVGDVDDHHHLFSRYATVTPSP